MRSCVIYNRRVLSEPVSLVLSSFERHGLGIGFSKISCDVLVLAGTEDDAIPFTQLEPYVTALTGARSVEKAIYDRA